MLRQWSQKMTDVVNSTAYLKVKQIFGLDYRSMALYRVLIGLTVIYDLYYRSLDMKAHYTDEGVFPRSIMMDHFFTNYWMSLHALYGSLIWQQILFFFHTCFAISLVLGYRTRLSAFLVWIFQNSVNNRNILLLYGGDLYLRVMLFWSIFIPMGTVYSLDSILNSASKFPEGWYFTTYRGEETTPRAPQSHAALPLKRGEILNGHTRTNRLEGSNLYLSFGTFGFIMQITLMYIFSYLPKTGAEWEPEGTATFWALSLDFFRTPLGDIMIRLPGWMLQFLTIAVLKWEGFGPLFFFSPILTEPIRAFGVLAFSFMHFSFWSSMRLEMFGALTVTVPLCLLPSWFWDRVIFWILRTKTRTSLRIYYNSECDFCTKLMKIIITFFVLPETRLETLSSLKSLEMDNGFLDNHNTQLKSLLNNPNTLWLVEYDKKYYSNIEALAIICKASPLLWGVSYLIFQLNSINFVQVIFHEMIHSHRDKNFSAPQETKKEFTSYSHRGIKIVTLNNLIFIFSNIFCASIIYGVLCWNMQNVQTPYSKHFQLEQGRFRDMFVTLQMDQIFDMFAPRPPKSDWWYHIEGYLADDTKTEIWRNGGIYTWEGSEFTWEKPDIYRAILRHRWYKYYERYGSHQLHEIIRLHYGRYICREWNARHGATPKRLKTFTVWWNIEMQFLDLTTKEGSKLEIWNHVC